MVFIWVLAGLAAFVALYVAYLRPWLREKEWAAGFFAAVEPIELHLWKKSESILWARFQQLLGVVLTSMGFLGGIDWTAITPFVPEKYQPLMPMLPLILTMLGTIAERLRNDTRQPLELVAVPTDAPIEVKVAKAEAALANEVAVDVVKDEKDKGTV